MALNADGRTAPSAGLTVLVVDDNHDVADSLALLLGLWGHEAVVAYDGAEALHLALAHRPQVLLLDIGLPQIDGVQLARWLREQDAFRTAVLVAVTGYADQASRGQWGSAFDHYLIKPVAPEEVERLLAAVRAHASAPALPRSPAVEATSGTGSSRR
jgi:two-component system CheB/CheR fusion protein